MSVGLNGDEGVSSISPPPLIAIRNAPVRSTHAKRSQTEEEKREQSTREQRQRSARKWPHAEARVRRV